MDNTTVGATKKRRARARAPEATPSNPPTLADVNAAWAAAHRPGAPVVGLELRTDPLRARPFYQGVIVEHLLQEQARAKGSRLYHAPTRARLRALHLTRLWLEFGAFP